MHDSASDPTPASNEAFDTTIPGGEALLDRPVDDPGHSRPAHALRIVRGRVDGRPVADELFRWLVDAPAAQASDMARVVDSLYADLATLMQQHLKREAGQRLLTPASVSHQAWMRLSENRRQLWGRRTAFLAVSAPMLRHLVVREALGERSARPGAELSSVMIVGLEQLAGTVDRDAIAVHDALLDFEAIEARAAKIVELRFFGGLENHEIAEALGLSLATVKRDWLVARTWLQRELSGS